MFVAKNGENLSKSSLDFIMMILWSCDSLSVASFFFLHSTGFPLCNFSSSVVSNYLHIPVHVIGWQRDFQTLSIACLVNCSRSVTKQMWMSFAVVYGSVVQTRTISHSPLASVPMQPAPPSVHWYLLLTDELYTVCQVIDIKAMFVQAGIVSNIGFVESKETNICPFVERKCEICPHSCINYLHENTWRA